MTEYKVVQNSVEIKLRNNR